MMYVVVPPEAVMLLQAGTLHRVAFCTLLATSAILEYHIPSHYLHYLTLPSLPVLSFSTISPSTLHPLLLGSYYAIAIIHYDNVNYVETYMML